MKNKIFSITQEQLTKDNVLTVVSDSSNVGDETSSEGGTYSGNDYNAVYVVEVTKAGAFGGTGEVTITCDSLGADDYGLEEIVKPDDGVAFSLGTSTMTLTLTDGGDSTLTKGDKWTVEGTGISKIVTIKQTSTFIDRENGNASETREFKPLNMEIKNDTGQILGFNYLSNISEYKYSVQDPNIHDLLSIPDGSTLKMSDFTASNSIAYVVLKATGSLSGDVTITAINYIKR